MNVGSNPAPWIETADVILVLDGMAPWWPDKHKPRDNCPIIQLGTAPHSRLLRMRVMSGSSRDSAI